MRKGIRLCCALLAVLTLLWAGIAVAATRLIRGEAGEDTITVYVNMNGRDSVTLMVREPGDEEYRYVAKDSIEDTFEYPVTKKGGYTFKAVLMANDKKILPRELVVFAGEQYDPAVYLPRPPEKITCAKDAMDAMNRTLLAYGEPSVFEAVKIREYFADIKYAGEFHNGFLVEGKLNYGATIRSDGNDSFYFDFAYDEAGLLLRERLYDHEAEETEDVELLRHYVKGTLLEILSKDMTDAEKARAIHDYIVKTFRYDNVNTEDYPAESFTALGLVKNGYAVCEGYAELFCLLCIYADLPCLIVTGRYHGTNHMWNQVKLDGRWYHVDCTLDDPMPDRGELVRDTYFMKSDEEFMAEGHVWEEGLWPEAEEVTQVEIAQ